MKSLYVLRHAKAKRSHSSGADHPRKLNTRGRAAAVRIGQYMSDKGFEPDIIVSSSSARTLETSQGVVLSLSGKPEVISQDSLYLADAERLLKTSQGLDDRHKAALLIGHNPGMHEFALELIENRGSALARKLFGAFPTAALAVITFGVDDWASVSFGTGQLRDMVFARELDDEDT